MTIKQIFDEIAAESSTNQKMVILGKYKDNETLKRVLYLANSKRIKFYIKQIPNYQYSEVGDTLEIAIERLSALSNREVTGDEAKNRLQNILSRVNSDDAYILERIIDKDCKIGMGTTFMNKVYKVNKTDKEFIEDTPYMGAVSFDAKKAKKIFEKDGIGYSDIKMDGRYCNSIIRGGDAELEARSGEPTIVTGAKFLGELTKFGDCVLNGELTIPGVPRTTSNGMIASIIDICGKEKERGEKEHAIKIANFEKKHGSFEKALASIIYTVWDRITVDEYFNKESKRTYDTRLEALRVELSSVTGLEMIKLIESKVVKSYAEAMEHFQEVLATEVFGVPQEGTILKSSKGEWKDGKPTWQIKMKLEMDVDLKIVGFNYGKKGSKNEHVVSSFSCESSDGLVKTRPQGLTEEKMIEVTANQDKLMGKIVQVKCNGLSHDSSGEYSLMYPSFTMIRDDKDTCDSLESIKEIENMVKSLTIA